MEKERKSRDRKLVRNEKYRSMKLVGEDGRLMKKLARNIMGTKEL